MWKHSSRVIVYNRCSSKNNRAGGSREVPNGVDGVRKLDMEMLNYAKDFRGLDDINHHFALLDHNEVSQRIVRALNFYDTATLAINNDVCFGSFVISVDILMPPGRAIELTGNLETLIKHAKYYVGKMTSGDQLGDGESAAWSELVRLTTVDFKRYYIARGKILHGNLQSSYSLSDADLKHVREIAHNAIRAYAYLARAFDWKCDKEAHNWFKSPHSPPKEAES